jgi:GTP pyrophosphokinase
MGKDIYAALLRRRVSGVKIQGLDSLMVRYARCCEPIPGDQVIGVVTRGRGVSVHRLGCSNLANIEPERLIDVSWDVGEEQVFQVKLTVTALTAAACWPTSATRSAASASNIHSGDFKGRPRAGGRVVPGRGAQPEQPRKAGPPAR